MNIFDSHCSYIGLLYIINQSSNSLMIVQITVH